MFFFNNFISLVISQTNTKIIFTGVVYLVSAVLTLLLGKHFKL